MLKFLQKLLLIAALCVPWATQAQISCDGNPPDTVANGTGTSTTTYFPGYSFYNYSYSEVIIPASTLSNYLTNEFKGLMFNPTVTTAGTYFTNCTIYLANTTVNSLSSGFIDDPATFEMVFAGNLSYTSTGWKTVEFDDSFMWDGSSNIVVAVVRSHGSYSSGATFAAYSASGTLGRYCYRDSPGPFVIGSINNSGASSGSTSTVPQYKLLGCEGEPPTCFKVRNLTVLDVSSDAATISWLDTMNSGATYTIYNMADTTAVASNLTDTFYTFTNLNANTLYRFGIEVDCGGGDVIGYSFVNFRTSCLPIDSLPWSQDFESASTGTSSTGSPFVDCMQRLNNGTTYGGYPYVSSSSSYNHTPGGNKGLYWYNTTTTGTYGDYEIVVLPPVNTDNYPINSLQFKFWAKSSSTSYFPVFHVGVMTNPDDASTFVSLDTINLGNSTTFTEYITSLASYTGTGRFVALRAVRPASSWYAYVDDLTLEVLPVCPQVCCIDATTTAGSALVTWNYHTAIAEPTGFNLTLIDSTGSTTTYTTTDLFYAFTGLNAGAEYKLLISADCGTEGEGAVDSIVFNTNSLACGYIDPTTTGYVELGNGVAEGTTYYLPLNNYYNYTYTQQLVLASELGGANEFTGIDFQYGYSSPSTVKTDVDIYLAHVSQTSLASAFVPYSSTTFQLVYSGSLNCTNGWNHFAFDTTFAYNGTDNLLIVVHDNSGDYDGSSYVFNYHNAPGMGRHDYNDDDPYALSSIVLSDGSAVNYRVNMKLHGYGCGSLGTCANPAMVVTGYTSDEVSVSWIPGYQESEWDLEYRQFGDTTWTSVATALTTTSYTVTNLSPATDYEFRISYVCTDNETYSATVSATTSCGDAVSLPYIQGFETVTTSTSSTNYDVMPSCWDYELIGSGSYTTGSYLPGVYYSSTYANTGNYSLRLAGKGYFTLPPIATTLDSVMLSMNCYITSAGYNIVVGVMDSTDFIPIDTVILSVSQHNPVEVSFAGYTGTSRTIALLNIYNTYDYSYVYVDDIVVNYLPECPRITGVSASNIGQSQATISWTPGNSGSYEVVYGIPGFNPNDSIAIVVTGADSVDIFNLNANTPYEVYVREICNGGGFGDWSYSYTFRTSCGELTVLPYFEDFEGLPAGASANLDCGIPCWGRLDNATTYHFGYIGNPSSWSTGGHSGTGFVYYYMPTTTGTYADWIITILPPVDTTIYPINTLQLSFWVKMNSTTTSGDIQIGVISDITDPTTFVPVDTVSVAGNVYDMKTAYLSSFVGSGNHIAMKYFRDPSTATYYFVDDVTLEPMPDCPPVSDITLAGLDSNYLSVTWTENGNATSWNVEYGLHGFTLGTGTSATVTSLPFTINGLATSTEYDVYVTPECTSGTSATRMETFRTASSSASLPFFCGFEGTGTNNWDFIQAGQNNYWVVGNAVSNSGSQSLYVTNDGSTNSYSGTESYSFATRTFNLQPGNYICSYDWKCNGESSFDFIRAALVPASVSIVAGGYCGFDNASAMPAGSIALDGGYRQNLQTSWQTQITEFTLSGAGSYNLVFLWRNDGSVYNLPPAAIDNVSLMLNTCPMPNNITASNLTQTSVDFTWTEPGSATQWEYQLDNGTPIATTSNNCSITGLTANTDYTFRVRSLCGAGDTSFWAVYNFRTPCGYMTLPYEQDFETEPTGSSTTGSTFVNCWTRLNNGTSYGGYPYVSSSSTYNHTAGGTKGLYWYNTTTTGTYGDYQGFVLAPVDPSVSIDSLQLSFWAKASSASYTNDFQIGVMTDPNNVSTFVGIDTVTVSGTNWTLVEVPFTGYTGAGQYIAVKSDRGTSAVTMYIDDILLDYVPTCLVPQNVHASEAGTTSITIDWTDVSAASEWEIEYAQQDAATTTSIFVTSHPYTFSSLDSMTAYTFRVRAVCTAGDTSHWSVAANLSTEMCDNAVVASTGAATSTTYYTPVNNYFKYTLSETIIDSAELAGSVDISAIAYDYAYSTPSSSKTDVTIWLQPTNKTVFSSSSDIELLDTTIAVKVYEGNLNCSQGWNYFTFDTVYTWDGHSNLMVIVDDNSNAYNGSSYIFNSSSCSGYKTLVWYSDTYHPDVFSSTYSGSKYYYNYRVSMKLISCGAGCGKPANLAATNVTYNSATLNWSSNATDFEVSWKANTEATWPTPVAVSGATTYAVTGLVPETAYQFMVRAICDTTEGISSDWVIGTFTTADLPCFVPTDLQADPNYTDATFSWTADASQTNWTLRIWNSAFDQEFDVTANPYTATGLTQNTTYNAAIKAVCGGGAAESEYG
ncbi:MAG: fibronectin type III domain-containing protein, partial [Bacteroidaceae bacterium]|nr:fibronectin type III domain-containing protein [Bacteroidaceae bacterium]